MRFMAPTPPHSAAVWLEPHQLEFARAALPAAEITATFAGSPAKGQSAAVAAALGAQPFDDLRAFLSTTDCPLVWLASAHGLGTTPDQADARAVAAAAARGVRIACSEPIPHSVLNLGPGGWASSDQAPAGIEAAQSLRYVGIPSTSRAWLDSQEVRAAFGSPRLVHIEAWCGPGDGSLAARLLGAMDLVLRVLGEPESINASFVGAGAGGAVLTTPPDTLSDLHGDLSAIMRTSDGRAAVIAASNGAGRWSSVITLISSEGRLRLYDDGFEWVGPEGVRRDEQRFSHRARGATDLAQTGARLTADGLQRLLSDSSPDPGPIPLAPVLVLCQTSLLSARTRNPESPESVRRMMLV